MGKPHGTHERIPALKVQAKPYGLGRVRGCVLASRVCLAPCPPSCPHRAGPFPTQVGAASIVSSTHEELYVCGNPHVLTRYVTHLARKCVYDDVRGQIAVDAAGACLP